MMFQTKYIIRTVFALSLVLLTLSCSKDDGQDMVPAFADWRQSSTVAYTEASAAIQLSGQSGLQWRAEIRNGGGWCSFRLNDPSVTVKEGTLQKGVLDNILDVYFTRNSGDQQRMATVIVTFATGASFSLDLVQLAQSQNNLPHFGVWAELPQQKDNPSFEYVTHYAPVSSRFVRNYSICYDLTKKAALWVAYPLHDLYLGSAGRTDAWAFDPVVDPVFQPNCISRSYGGPYDRGHQLPSADRQVTNEMNAQTFYMTNMTPQLNRLNQDMWAKLEAKVRTYNCSDTLYVVTGAWFGPGALTTTDGSGKTVPIPTHYFKVLLRSQSGRTGKTVADMTSAELISIGFWAEQKSYGNIQPPRSICTSVADIEARTGFTFFPALSASASAAVKSQNNPAQWGIN